MYAIATLLYDPKYLPGALVLGHALRKISSPEIRLIVLVEKTAFEDWQLHLLSEIWHEVINTRVSESSLHQKLVHDLKRPELAKTYTKIELWNLPYQKVLYLDADTLPLQGPNLVTDLLKLDFPTGKILAAPDSGFPDIFNSGVFVLRPNSQDYHRLAKLVHSNASSVSFDGADQGLLNQYFNSDPDWVSQLLDSGNNSVDSSFRVQTTNWVPIPFLYNTTPNAQYQYFPASNHFGYPGTSSEDWASQNNPLRSQSDARNSTFSRASNVSPYDNIPLEHFSKVQGKSQVSVLHFIGASKPWNDESSPVFKQWWSQWYEYSQGKPLDVVLRHHSYTILINPLKTPSATPDAFHPRQVKTPIELCDPQNYQHIQSQVESTALSWDATKEMPPKEIPDVSHFDLVKKPFHNDWDDYKQQEEKNKEHALNSSEFSRIFEAPSRFKQEGYKKDESRGHQGSQMNQYKPLQFGVHEDQVAERVFDERSDYTPHHLLMMTDKESLGNISPAKASTSMAGSSSDLEKAFSQVTIKENNGSIEQKTANECKSESVYTDLKFEDEVPKIFPWEHRDYQAERVWE
ncbi:hypothetical protein JCM33374_g5976 [Metschnikowia sp. JCM 33374]|nr:hypothetical protein JCM33374_g5976 [Metschnikowia sp. JCM 33374]